MTQRTGRDIKIGIGKESSRGTAVVPTFWIPRRTFDFDDKKQEVIDDQSYGVIEDVVGHRVVGKWAEGTLGGVVRDKAIGLLFLNALGQVSTQADTPEAGVNTHTFTVLQDHQHPSLTVSVEDPDGDIAYPLAMLRTLTLSATLNEFVLFTADFISKKSESQAITPAYAEENDFAANDIAVKIADNIAGLSGASATEVKSIEVVEEQEIEKDDVLGSVDPSDMLNKLIRVRITITKAQTDTTFKDYFTAGTSKALGLYIKNTAVTIGASSNPEIQVELNKVMFLDWVASKELDGIVVETLTIRAAFKIADAKMIQVKVINTQASY